MMEDNTKLPDIPNSLMECLSVFQLFSPERDVTSLSLQITDVISIIARMIERMLSRIVREYLGEFPAVALLGPRQVGKTTLALEIGRADNALYLDLESERDKSKLALPEEYLWEHRERLVILDEVHRLPGLFPLLRGSTESGGRERVLGAIFFSALPRRIF